MPTRFRSQSLAVALLLVSPLAVAQEHPNFERGISAATGFQHGELDSVNLFNGNYHLSIPLGRVYPLNAGTGYGLALHYNSAVWDFEDGPVEGGSSTVISVPDPFSNAGLGWVLTMGRLYAPFTSPWNDSSSWLLLEPDGSKRIFASTLHTTDTAVAGVRYTRDGSYLRMLDLAGSEKKVESPDGTIRIFRSDGKLRQITDQFGNWVDVAYPSSTTQTLTDMHGRTQTITLVSTGTATGHVSTVTLDGFGALTSQYTFTYTSAAIERHRKHTSGTTSPTVTVPLLTSVTLPDSSTYSMSYYLTRQVVDGIPQTPGAIKQLTLPTLGRYDFVWAPYSFLSTAPDPCGEPLCAPFWVSSTDGLQSKKIYNAAGTFLGNWKYVQANGFSTLKTETVVTTPAGNETKHYFRLNQDSWEHGLPYDPGQRDATNTRFLSQDVYQGTVATGTLKRRVYLRFGTDQPGGMKTNPRVESRRILYEDDKDGGGVAKYADVTWSRFDGLGHYREMVTAGNFESANVRTATTNFNPLRGVYLYDAATSTFPAGHTFSMLPSNQRWVLDTFDETIEKEGSQEIKTQYCFESVATSPPGHTGFLSKVRAMSGPAPGATDLLTVFTRATNGNVTLAQSYGGDVQALATTADLCALAPPASDQFRVAHGYQYGVRNSSEALNSSGGTIGFKFLNLTVDSSGLVSSSRDLSDIATNYEYDTSDRLVWDKPATGHGAWTGRTYVRATSSSSLARIDPRSYANGTISGTPLAQSKLFFDAFGRPWKEQVQMPDATGTFTTRERLYNAMGWLTSVSEWGATAKKTTFSAFDPFGRPSTVVPPDGTAHQINLTYKGDREATRQVRVWTTTSATQESWVTTTERYDRQGRLYQVVEPSGAGGANVTTTYGYDAGSRLKSTSTPATVTQTRAFTYDNRGVLLSEKHPEKGTTGNGTVTYSSFNALGQPRQTVDGASSLTFSYDRAGRVIQISETNGGRVLATYSYASANGTGDWRKGKLQSADRFNYLQVGTVPYTVQIRDTFVYGGKGGRVSSRDTFWANSTTGENFTQGWTYTDLGAVASIAYPRCTQSGCTGAAATTRTVNYGYTNGFLTSVPGYATTIAYNANGTPGTISHPNGVLWTQAQDANSMPRPASIKATLGATTLWDTGPYTYDGAGNVASTGPSTYRYDSVSRLATASVVPTELGTGTPKSQTFTHDAFGNLSSIAGSGGAPGRTIPITASTNRLTTAGAEPSCLVSSVYYDASGNLLCWLGNSYTYDQLGATTRTLLSGVEYDHAYSAFGERMLTYQPNVGFRWTMRGPDGKVLRELKYADPTWSVERDYVYREGTLLGAVHASGEVHHFHTDHLGTPRLITGNGGVKKAFHAYYPFGEEATSITQDTERMKFTGHERDLGITTSAADDLDYQMARFYNPQLGRYLPPDPIGGDPWLPQSWNRYAYVLGNPLLYVHPWGLDEDALMKDNPFQDYMEVRSTPLPWWFWFVLRAPGPGGGGGSGGGGGATRDKQDQGHLGQINALEYALSEIPIDGLEFGECVESNRLDWGAVLTAHNIANPLANWAVGDTGRTGLGGVKPHATTWQHKLGSKLSTPTNATFSRIGRAAGRLALVPTIFEGYYDLAAIGRCAALAGG